MVVYEGLEGDESGVVGVVVVNGYGIEWGGELGMGWGSRCGSV